MATRLTDEEVQEALDECAAEPVHIPGNVQPYGALVCFDPQTETILYASENCQTITGHTAASLLNSSFREVFGRELIHAIRNVAGQPNFARESVSLGNVEINGQGLELHAFGSDGRFVVEFEAEGDIAFSDQQGLDVINLMIKTIQNCTSQQSLLDLTVSLMRHLTGYDRVMIYKFDQEFNGEVIAEEKRASMEPFVGLRFPSSDIPSQARAIMARVPIRFIEDVDQTPVPLLAAAADLPPLDISLAVSRGVSPVHLEYLRNMGSQATLTLSILLNDQLWGIISFHHGKSTVPAARLRRVLSMFLPIFSSKLETLLQSEMLEQIKHVEQIKDSLMLQIGEDAEMDAFLPGIAPTVLEILNADGASALIGSQSRNYGQVPGQSVLDALLQLAHEDRTRVLAIDNLVERFPQLQKDLNGIAGAIVYAIEPGRAICFFRQEIERKIAWAGNPDKTIENVSGHSRLIPRGSFSTYLQTVGGMSEAWTDRDLFFTHRIWEIINSAERRALLNTLNRQQALMIDELNHRVRNILALVRSVSSQARRRYGSLNSYSKSLEARIQALAAAHDIASGESTHAVSVQSLIRTEYLPYEEKDELQVVLSGADPQMRADIAPIFSLVIHELTTNAAKYGALSVAGGVVTVTVERSLKGYSVIWQESGGPTVSEPESYGFGSTLIREAVPHEMNGKATLTFAKEGVVAELFLPDELFDLARTGRETVSITRTEGETLSLAEKVGFSGEALSGTAMVLDDNFVIAKEMGDQIADFGFQDVVKFPNAQKALEFIDSELPVVAVLDINLGGGRTSERVAQRLLEHNVAFVFVTAYGETAELSAQFDNVPRLRKPVEESELKRSLAVQLSRR